MKLFRPTVLLAVVSAGLGSCSEARPQEELPPMRSTEDGGWPSSTDGGTPTPIDAGLSTDAGQAPDVGPEIDAGPAPKLLVVTSTSIDFGTVGVGCTQADSTLMITNVGSASTMVAGASVLPPLTPFEVDGPVLPVILSPEQSIQVTVSFSPPRTGRFAADLTIRTSDPGTASLNVALAGTGGPERVDTFTQHPQAVGDILIVIDDSGSNNDEQQVLAESFPQIRTAFSSLDLDFHLGITTTDAINVQGALVGATPVITSSTANADQIFSANINVGGNGSGTEQGLEASRLAFWGGANPGFLRDEAWLTIIYLSDEDDQSTLPVEDYVGYFHGLKGSDRFQANAIVGDTPLGCNGPGGGAERALRYAQMVADTGGVNHSICSPPWTDVFSNLGGEGYGYKLQVELSRSPDPGSIEVRVNGQLVPQTDWSHTPGSHTIRFAPKRLPPPGSTIEVTYTTPEC